MTKLEKLKKELKTSNKKAKEKKKSGSEFLYNWYEGYTDGLEKAISIIEEGNNEN